MQQAHDFLTESNALHALIEPLGDAQMARQTAFKQWSVDEVIRHLHVWNHAANLSLTDEEGFKAFYEGVGSVDGGLRVFEQQYLEGLSGHKLLATWREFYADMAPRFAAADPSMRVLWAGPSMSARSSITARLMETWAHGQAIYDLMGVVRNNGDHIRNIVILGNNTYGWTYAVRKLEPPEPRPELRLTAPSGEVWVYNEGDGSERIEGLAEEFCQVVTQVRNIEDVDLQLTGDNAKQWMSFAQCFAGPPEPPPAPGLRRTLSESERLQAD